MADWKIFAHCIITFEEMHQWFQPKSYQSEGRKSNFQFIGSN